VAGLYLWNPLSIAAAVGGSPAGLENAAVFAALAGALQPACMLHSAHMC
jgi:GPI transamidase subunit PIG-U